MFKSNLATYKEITRDESKKFIEQHYLGKFPATSSEYVGIFYNDVLVGVVIYGSPASPSALLGVFKPEANAIPKNLIELQRLFITGDTNVLPEDDRKGLAGYSIVKANDIVSKKRPELKVIISYSDPAKHQGTVYKATGAIYLGRGRDYYEFEKDGKIIRQSRATPEEKKTLKKVKMNGKDRYVYPVGSHSQRNWVKRHLNTPSVTEMLWEDFKKSIINK